MYWRQPIFSGFSESPVSIANLNSSITLFLEGTLLRDGAVFFNSKSSESSVSNPYFLVRLYLCLSSKVDNLGSSLSIYVSSIGKVMLISGD